MKQNRTELKRTPNSLCWSSGNHQFLLLLINFSLQCLCGFRCRWRCLHVSGLWEWNCAAEKYSMYMYTPCTPCSLLCVVLVWHITTFSIISTSVRRKVIKSTKKQNKVAPWAAGRKLLPTCCSWMRSWEWFVDIKWEWVRQKDQVLRFLSAIAIAIFGGSYFFYLRRFTANTK